MDITNSVSNTRWYYEIDLYDSILNLVPKDSSDPDRLTWSQLVGDYLLEVAITNGVKRCSSPVTNSRGATCAFNERESMYR